MNSPSPEQLGREALAALRGSRDEQTSHERFQHLIQMGWINSRGEVTRLLGGDAEPEEVTPPESNSTERGANGQP